MQQCVTKYILSSIFRPNINRVNQACLLKVTMQTFKGYTFVGFCFVICSRVNFSREEQGGEP